MPKTNYYYFTEQPYTGYDPALQGNILPCA